MWKNMSIRSNIQYSMAEVTSESSMYIKLMIVDSWDRKKLIRPNMDICRADIILEVVNESVEKVLDRGLICQKYVQ